MRSLVRRYRIVGAITMVVALLVGVAGSGRAVAEGEPFVLGSGGASASVVKARLFYAGYALPIPLGLSATTYENRQSRALGGAYDLTSVTGLVGNKVPQLSPISVDSNSGDATKGADLGAGAVLGRIDLSAKAVPSSHSEVRLADIDLPGLLRVEGGHSRSSTEVVDGIQREAVASSTVAAVSLLGGLMTIDGLTWTATHRTGAVIETTGAFTLGAVRVAGIPLATDLDSLVATLDVVNLLLAPTGLVLEVPRVVELANGGIEVTGLRVGIVNSPLGAEQLAPIVAGLRPLLLPVFEGLSGIDSTLGLASLLADLGLGVVDGSGGLELTIGGATARTDDATFVDPFGVPSPVAPSSEVPVADVAPTPTFGGVAPVLAAPVAAPPALPVASAPQLVPASTDGPIRCVLVASPRRQGSCRGTNVAGAVGIVAIVVAGIAAYELVARRRRPTSAVSTPAVSTPPSGASA